MDENKNILSTIILVILFSWISFKSISAKQSSDSRINHSISEEVLIGYLSHAITQGEFCLPGSDAEFDENLRMLKNIGAKFIGRAAFEWTPNMDNEDHFATVEKYAKKAHEADSDFMLQCCIFEAVFHSNNQLTAYGLDLIPVPEFVFREFGVPVQERNFDYNAMLYKDGKYQDQWANGGSVPDISQVETQMYFYYRAARYIDAGFEAIHLGQVELMNHNDRGNKTWFELVGRIRQYAREHARKGLVLIDAHVPRHGIVSDDGRLLLDFHSFPMRPKDICGKPFEAELEVDFLDALYQKSKGGITPGGWKCNALPYLVEFDNSGADKNYAGNCNNPTPYWPWGWDEITWFAHCTPDYRNYWIGYVVNWLKVNDPIGHLQMPGSITIAPDPVIVGDKKITLYKLNTNSITCPNGFSQEETVKEIWSK